jgi:hypothetical protein
VTKAKDNLINDNNNVLQKMKRYFDIMDDDDSEVLQYFKSIGIKIEELEKPKIATTSL